MVTKRDLLGVKVREPLRIWLWNGEDPMDELSRRIAATCLHYGVSKADIAGRLFVDSGRDLPTAGQPHRRFAQISSTGQVRPHVAPAPQRREKLRHRTNSCAGPGVRESPGTPQ